MRGLQGLESGAQKKEGCSEPNSVRKSDLVWLENPEHAVSVFDFAEEVLPVVQVVMASEPGRVGLVVGLGPAVCFAVESSVVWEFALEFVALHFDAALDVALDAALDVVR